MALMRCCHLEMENNDKHGRNTVHAIDRIDANRKNVRYYFFNAFKWDEFTA